LEAGAVGGRQLDFEHLGAAGEMELANERGQRGSMLEQMVEVIAADGTERERLG
jgi:hypothetical protein